MSDEDSLYVVSMEILLAVSSRERGILNNSHAGSGGVGVLHLLGH